MLLNSRLLISKKRVILVGVLCQVYLLSAFMFIVICIQCGDIKRDLPGISKYPLYNDNFRQLVYNSSAGLRTEVNSINLNYTRIKITNGASACDKPLDLLLIVRSKVSNFRQRRNVRRTWANPTHLRRHGVSVKSAFVVGDPLNEYERARIFEEAQFHQDLVIGDFTDTYVNLTYKTMTGIRWAKEWCDNFRVAVLVDDDMYLSIANLLRFLRDPEKYPANDVAVSMTTTFGILPDQHFYAGQLFGLEKTYPQTCDSVFSFITGGSKHCIPWEDYPFRIFPPYVSGGANIISRRTLVDFYYGSAFVQHLNIEDVYLGLIAFKLGITPFDASTYVYCCGSIDKNCPVDPKRKDFLENAIAVHRVLFQKQQMHSSSSNCESLC